MARGKSGMPTWFVQVWYDEDDDRPEEPGGIDEIQALSEDAARDEWRRQHPEVRAVAFLRVAATRAELEALE